MERLGKPDSAEIFYKKALDRAALKTHYANQLANLFVTHSQLDSAYKYFGLAIREDESNVSAKVNLANLKLALGDTVLAVRDYEEILSRNPSLIALNYNLAVVYYRQHKIDLAKKQIEKCLSINPSYQPAINLLNILQEK